METTMSEEKVFSGSPLHTESPTSCKPIAQKVPQTYPKPKLERLTNSEFLEREIKNVMKREKCSLNKEIFAATFANPLHDTSDPSSREIFHLFSSESIAHLAGLPESSHFLIAELPPDLPFEGVPPVREKCKLCGEVQHDAIRATQELTFKNRFEIFQKFSGESAVIEYETYRSTILNGVEIPLFIVTVTLLGERHIYEFGGWHSVEVFPCCVEEIIFCIESLAKLAFDFLFNKPDSILKNVKNITFWDVTQCFRSESAMTREILYFYPLSNTYNFKAEVDFLAEGHGRPADDYIIIPTTEHKKYLVFNLDKSKEATASE
jgi:hypothetical protein